MNLDLRFDRAIEIVSKTAPYVIFRAGMYLCVCAVLALALALLGLVGFFAGSAVFTILLLISVTLWLRFGVPAVRRSSLVRSMRAGHLALIGELAAKGRLPEGATSVRLGAGTCRAAVQEGERGVVHRRPYRRSPSIDPIKTCLRRLPCCPFRRSMR